MSIMLLLLCACSILCAAATGRTAEAGRAMLEGAGSAVELGWKLAGALCFWSAVTELLEKAGAAEALSAFLRRPLKRLFPGGAADGETLAALSENLSANLLGLGNAATPAGIRAARGLRRLGREEELCRASLGAAAPFDITPAVWICSLLSLTAGLGAAALLRRVWRG